MPHRTRAWSSRPVAHALRVALLLILLAVSRLPGEASRAAPGYQGRFAPGTVVALRGTPQLWFAGADGALHWGGDTRALADRAIAWGRRVELAVEPLRALPRGDPWLSAGLLQDDGVIYLPKWETGQDVPTLLLVRSITDLELFGIDGRNYGRLALERAEWEQRYGVPVDTCPPGELTRDTSAPDQPGQVLLADDFADAAAGMLPRLPRDPSQTRRGYQGGEYLLEALVPRIAPYVRVPGMYGGASIAVDARLVGETDGRVVLLGCRENTAGDRQYALLVDPGAGEFALWRDDGPGSHDLVRRAPSAALRRGHEVNRLELSCRGGTITVRINGTQVASVQDRTYGEGRLWIAVSPVGDIGTVAARLDNLVVTQQ